MNEIKYPSQHKIIVTSDNWVYVKKSDGTEIGLGDLGVDVIIEHDEPFKRKWNMMRHSERILALVKSGIEFK